MMLLRWLGVALLAFSWLPGLGYFHSADPVLWVALLVPGSLLLAGWTRAVPDRRTALAALVMLAPALALAPLWPYRAPLLLLMAGMAASCLPLSHGWRARLGSAGVVPGVILLVQSLALYAYESLTAYSHDLPRPLGLVLLGVAKLLGIDAGLSSGGNGPHVALHSMRQTHLLGTTWELLFDPATMAFLVGGLVLLALRAWDGDRARSGLRRFARPALVLGLVTLAWLPVRAGFQMGILLHRGLRTAFEEPLTLAHQLWSTPLLLALMAVPVLLTWRFVRVKDAEAGEPAEPPRPMLGLVPGVLLVGLAAAAWTAALFWTPVGERKGGRVIVDEHLSSWESTEKAFDTEWYGKDNNLGRGQESGYNYAVMYDYCSRFYEMSRLKTAVTDQALAKCDVFIVKCPTARYKSEEVAALVRFVERGGGILFIGEHTNVFQMGISENDIASHFGFRWRYDCLFGVDTIFEQAYDPPLVPHPIIQSFPHLDFAISCSIAPRLGTGRTVIRGIGLKSQSAEYHVENFYPQVEDLPQCRYGSFVQLWAGEHGAGRVVAFGDSTEFSNFCLFDPGKSELLLGMIEWLNHRGWTGLARRSVALLGLLGLALAVPGLLLLRRARAPWMLTLGAVVLGWSIAVPVVRDVHASAMPPPPSVRPMTRVLLDRTVCDAPLGHNGFVGGKAGEFCQFRRSILRLGFFTAHWTGETPLQDNLIVFLYPNKAVSEKFAGQVARYVEGGGRVLVVDDPENAGSTANTLLKPFGLTVGKANILAGAASLEGPASFPSVPVPSASEVGGGRPLFRVNGRVVGATSQFGRGTVTVLGFGRRFTDPQMGVISEVVPDASLRKVFDLEFALLRAIIGDKVQTLASP